MSYISYSGLKTPNEVISKIAEFIKTTNITVVQDLVDDYDIYKVSEVDGKKFAFKLSHTEADKTIENVVVLRSANGTNIFGYTDDSQQSNMSIEKNANYEGIGMTVGDAYSATATWYNQQNTPHVLKNTKSLGVFMPVPTHITGNTYTLYCNYLSKSGTTLVFSIVRENTFQRQSAHLIVGNLNKYDTWHGGVYFTGSLNASIDDFTECSTAYKLFEDTYSLAQAYTHPVFCQCDAGGTYLQIDIDEAVSDSRGNIHWASSHIDKTKGTGKQLALPIRENTNGADVPNYYYIQSKDRLDWGRNNNLLNCITVDLPFYFAICVDPDVIQDYACCGYAYGINYISLLNFQTGETYHVDKYDSNNKEQVFPMDKRRGYYGFDGFGVEQETSSASDSESSASSGASSSSSDTSTSSTQSSSTTTASESSSTVNK